MTDMSNNTNPTDKKPLIERGRLRAARLVGWLRQRLPRRPAAPVSSTPSKPTSTTPEKPVVITIHEPKDVATDTKLAITGNLIEHAMAAAADLTTFEAELMAHCPEASDRLQRMADAGRLALLAQMHRLTVDGRA
jgi:hypothetical protein